MAHAEDLPESSPVSAEARGKAREFIRRASAEDSLRFGLLNGFWRDIQQRVDRHPGSRIRPDKLKDIIHRWQVGPRQFRLRFEVEWKGKNLSAIEITASGSAMLSGAPDWGADATELNLMINTAALKADRQGTDLVNIGTFCLSFHAIGRYFQRQPDRGEAALLQDLALFSRITVPIDAPEQDVRYPTEGGAWVGRIALCTVEGIGQIERRAVPFIRTWLPV
jgi:hypothetical protein